MRVEQKDYLETIIEVLDNERCNPLEPEGLQMSNRIFSETKEFQDEIYSVCKNREDHLIAEAAINALVFKAQDVAFEYGFKKAICIILDGVSESVRS